ncbi:transglutaminase domain-containing protein [Agromyces soli]
MTTSAAASAAAGAPAAVPVPAAVPAAVPTRLEAVHSPYSDPGRHRALVAAVAPEPRAIHRAVTRTVGHYRASPTPPTAEQLADVDRRWIASVLDAATARAAGPLDAPRAPAQRVGGCCRDHSLLAVSILREHGRAARTRLGFADYFTPGYRHDHVVVETLRDGRWLRFDPELGEVESDGDRHLAPALTPALEPDSDAGGDAVGGCGRAVGPGRGFGGLGFDVDDLPTGEGAPFETAAEAWLAYRAGRLELGSYGVAPGIPIGGAELVHAYVLGDLAHRMRCELLLWDVWGAMDAPDAPLDTPALELADRIATLTVAADAGAPEAESALAELWAEPGVAPGRFVMTRSPSGRTGSTDLVQRITRWAPGTD